MDYVPPADPQGVGFKRIIRWEARLPAKCPWYEVSAEEEKIHRSNKSRQEDDRKRPLDVGVRADIKVSAQPATAQLRRCDRKRRCTTFSPSGGTLTSVEHQSVS